ncbi:MULTISPECIES: hypothetical protein [unclassified Aeromicrobium]|uniref:hypothetical protein n=1 Tax=unclassified Aeromicrobium TaxID=2633570 RepID=UPI00288A9102|nr:MULTISPECIES: hypothetical protein [unclassified Aeromicrobium]
MSAATVVRVERIGWRTLADGACPWVEVDGVAVDWTAAGAPVLPIVSRGCDGCAGRGVLPASDGPHGVQRCDECQAYGGDCEAAEVVAALLGGVAYVELDED